MIAFNYISISYWKEFQNCSNHPTNPLGISRLIARLKSQQKIVRLFYYFFVLPFSCRYICRSILTWLHNSHRSIPFNCVYCSVKYPQCVRAFCTRRCKRRDEVVSGISGAENGSLWVESFARVKLSDRVGKQQYQ